MSRDLVWEVFCQQPIHETDPGRKSWSRERMAWIASVLDLPENGLLLDIAETDLMAHPLPYADATFDMVISRFAMHSLESPLIQVQEMARICKPGARVALIDIAAPEDESLALCYNEIVWQHDAAFVEALSQTGLQDLLRTADLEVVSTFSRDFPVSLFRWFELAGTDHDSQQRILTSLRNELAGGAITGLRPFISDYDVMFTQQWVITVGKKVS